MARDILPSSTKRGIKVYQIKYSYRTGDSFHTEDREELLEYEWEDIKAAKEALRRIEEHYKWYESVNSPWMDDVKRPEWHNIKPDSTTKDMEHNLLNLVMDNGEEVQFWAPWCGYFETLYGASIVISGKDMHFTI